jgi:hypothetical protein
MNSNGAKIRNAKLSDRAGNAPLPHCHGPGPKVGRGEGGIQSFLLLPRRGLGKGGYVSSYLFNAEQGQET